MQEWANNKTLHWFYEAVDPFKRVDAKLINDYKEYNNYTIEWKPEQNRSGGFYLYIYVMFWDKELLKKVEKKHITILFERKAKKLPDEEQSYLDKSDKIRLSGVLDNITLWLLQPLPSNSDPDGGPL